MEVVDGHDNRLEVEFLIGILSLCWCMVVLLESANEISYDAQGTRLLTSSVQWTVAPLNSWLSSFETAVFRSALVSNSTKPLPSLSRPVSL